MAGCLALGRLSHAIDSISKSTLSLSDHRSINTIASGDWETISHELEVISGVPNGQTRDFFLGTLKKIYMGPYFMVKNLFIMVKFFCQSRIKKSAVNLGKNRQKKIIYRAIFSPNRAPARIRDGQSKSVTRSQASLDAGV